MNVLLLISWESLHGIMAKVLDRNIVVSKFKPQLHYHIYFQTNILVKGMNLFSPGAMG